MFDEVVAQRLADAKPFSTDEISAIDFVQVAGNYSLAAMMSEEESGTRGITIAARFDEIAD